ncbi:hypothetical protein [Leptolyngbya sp. NIES-2104]|uniref:hypothetical protein n=1 Tax=Leptolyngbya sp. NIES-2104 TaxID=1552121 RepID=UPI0006EC858C|nr:hypothetical protein [Leptolyngbya sp. NIES-2104]GAP96682.1 thioredoxin reductase [Leptolyngbya sp. NIES-2104]
MPVETSIPGIFAAGVVRSGFVKRAASAVGEGAIISQVHQFLGEQTAESLISTGFVA